MGHHLIISSGFFHPFISYIFLWILLIKFQHLLCVIKGLLRKCMPLNLFISKRLHWKQLHFGGGGIVTFVNHEILITTFLSISVSPTSKSFIFMLVIVANDWFYFISFYHFDIIFLWPICWRYIQFPLARHWYNYKTELELLLLKQKLNKRCTYVLP